MPVINCAMFAGPKQSRVDIVQAAGRALRRYPRKDCGYIVVPLVVPNNMDFETFADTTAFRQVAQTITALSTQDELFYRNPSCCSWLPMPRSCRWGWSITFIRHEWKRIAISF